MNKPIIDYLLHLADNSLILGQRNAEWCGHGPILEQDIAITNISLDLIGQSRSFYQYAAQLKNDNTTEDSLAFFRTEREFKNFLLLEQPNGDWAQTILKQFFFSSFQFLLFQQLQKNSDETLAAIAEKSLKEISYHLRWSSEWVERLGDGTEESRNRILNAVNNLWRFTGELFIPAAYETELGIELNSIKENWQEKINEIFKNATLPILSNVFFQTGGKTGNHTEQLGFILTELQYMQRTFPGCEW